MAVKATEFTSPPGRMVWGSLYEPNTKDFDGNPMVVKKGVDAGKPTQRYEFGVAIPKTTAHFANEPGWGDLIWAAAHAAFPGNPNIMEPLDAGAFSWKIVDGDSVKIQPKSKSKVRPCDKEGFAGHWVLTFSSSFAPKIFDARDVNNAVALEGKDAIVPGYVVQVIGSVAGNTGNTPGVYLNHAAVGLRAYLPEIRSAMIDVAGKFGGALPSGATVVPVGGFAPPAAPVAAAPAPAPAAAVYVAPAAPAPAPAAPSPVAVKPAPALVGIPVAPVPVAPAAPAKPTWAMLAAAGWAAANWSEETARAAGHCS